MSQRPVETCWTILRAAADGDDRAMEAFATSYTAPIRSYLLYRWSHARLRGFVDDAIQDVFVECIKPGGALASADPTNGEFRALLHAVVRNIARRYEERAARAAPVADSQLLRKQPDGSEALSRMFDRTWAQFVVRDAVLRHARSARVGDSAMRRRYRVLRMRHQDGLPIRTIAERLGVSDVAEVHNAYRRGRREFRVHLREAVAQHTGAPASELDAACLHVQDLLRS